MVTAMVRQDVIGWHLGHQAHVAHFMIRNLTAAEPSPDPALDGLMDSALPEQFRGALPTVPRLSAFRETVAEHVHARIGDIAAGKVSAPTQLTIVATCLMTALTQGRRFEPPTRSLA